MKFGKDLELNKAHSNYERAIIMLKDKKPMIGSDTKEDSGRFFIFNMEVDQKEYEDFLDQYNEIMDEEIQHHDMAA